MSKKKSATKLGQNHDGRLAMPPKVWKQHTHRLKVLHAASGNVVQDDEIERYGDFVEAVQEAILNIEAAGDVPVVRIEATVTGHDRESPALKAMQTGER